MIKYLLLFILILSTGILHSQMRVRPDSTYLAEPRINVYHTKLPILQNIPPIHSAMPFDIQLAYLALDSFCRTNTNPFWVDDWIKNVNLTNDTLHTLWQYAYKAIDYDPFRFYQYLEEQYIQSKKYRTYFTFKTHDIIDKSYKLPLANKYHIYSALRPMFVLRVSVMSIDSMKSSIYTQGDSTQYNHFKITCLVTDTLKGKKIPMFCLNQNSTKKTKDVNENLSNNCFFEFYISLRTYPQPRPHSHFSTPFPMIDPLIYDKSRQIMRFQPGQDLIVFLGRGNVSYSRTHDYIQIHPEHYCSNGVLPIINGMVSDVNKVWSDNKWISYSTWKEKFNDAVNIILTKGY